MARSSLILKRDETWGSIYYDTIHHIFSYKEKEFRSIEPISSLPVALNIVITRRCNMNCQYCVAKDFEGIEKEDIVLSQDMIQWLNRSPFMLLVLTGGEPLMPPYDAVSMKLINSVKDKGVIIDTNGTFLPDPNMLEYLKKRRVMVRVSMDSTSPKEEISVRIAQKGQDLDSISAYDKKLANIERFLSAGVCTAVQTVFWRNNKGAMYQMIDWLSERRIKQWYLQRLIPSYKFKEPPERSAMHNEDYYPEVKKIAIAARSAGIECYPKMDLRHNSVFLLTADGMVYTQGNKPGQKVKLGTIRDEIGYFNYVSASDHACRYYLVPPHRKEQR